MSRDLTHTIARLKRRLHGIDLHTGAQYRIAYNFDATNLRGRCGGVIFPPGLKEFARTLREARNLGVPIYVRGAGSGFSGGSIPLDGGLVVSTERMRRILAFDEGAREVEVEVGVVNQELQDYLAPHGFFYPPDPASLKFSTIGGNLAENAGGPRAYKYGVTRRYVRSLTWITSRGEILTTPLEGAAALIIGSEGTLAAVYSARLAVLPLPQSRRTGLIAAGGDEETMGVAASLLATGFVPSVMEFIDSRTMACVGEYRGVEGLESGKGYLFVEVDGAQKDVDGQYRLLERFCADAGLGLMTARNEEERELLWELRRSVSPSLARRGVTKVNEDVSLPLGRLEEAVSFIHGTAKELGLECYIFGHCGDGNLHVNIMTDRRRKEEMERVGVFVDRLFEWVAGMGGTLSGEHGIGLTKKSHLGAVFSQRELAFQGAVRNAMDNSGLLNRGKYFAPESEDVHR